MNSIKLKYIIKKLAKESYHLEIYQTLYLDTYSILLNKIRYEKDKKGQEYQKTINKGGLMELVAFGVDMFSPTLPRTILPINSKKLLKIIKEICGQPNENGITEAYNIFDLIMYKIRYEAEKHQGLSEDFAYWIDFWLPYQDFYNFPFRKIIENIDNKVSIPLSVTQSKKIKAKIPKHCFQNQKHQFRKKKR